MTSAWVHVEPFVARAKVFRAMPRGYFIAGRGEIAKDEMILGEFRLDVRLEPSAVLLAVRECIANDGHMVSGL